MDILIFAAIAIFVILKLRSQLGKIDEDEKRIIQEKINQHNKLMEEIQKQMVLVGQKATAQSEQDNLNQEKLLQNLEAKSKSDFIKAITACNITAEFFINGAKSAFDMVIKAFASSDLETLKFLLSEKIYQSFEQAISQRKASGQILVSNVIAIDNVEILSALVVDNNASIVVKISSKQINYISNQSGDVIEGRKNEINQLTDIWTFSKDITSQNPNWIIISTHS